MTHEQAVSTFASERYLLDEMTEPERSTFEDHYFSCTECADDVRAGGVMRDGVRAGLLEDQVVRNNVHDMTVSAAWRRKTDGPRRWYQSAAIPWAAAATLAVVAGYQTFVVSPGRTLGEPVALAPVTLRPASRGQEPKVQMSRDGAVTLAVDLSSSVSGNELPYTIRTAAGANIASGSARTPQAGAPLLLLVPSSLLKTSGRYILAIADSEYPFELVAQ